MIPFLESVVKRAGAEAMAYFNHSRENAVTSKKNRNDLVSAADKAVEKVIIGAIRERYPEDAFFGEESGRSGTVSEYCWVIDPIDGTQSFVKIIPSSPFRSRCRKTAGRLRAASMLPRSDFFFPAKRDAELLKTAFRSAFPTAAVFRKPLVPQDLPASVRD